MDALEQLKFNLGRNAAYEAEGDDVLPAVGIAVRLFAFYLPQFHPIPENDEWWGKGFTEWTNVTKALPRFEGHYQPQLPADLGFYDLRLLETIRRQVELAKRYGIAGFCFHWYWFSGRRLLERPLDIFLSDKTIDFPFFINWANENWTRRWDGMESSILMEQHYSEADDLAIAEEFLRLIKDQRYLRIDGRPVIMVYRPSKMPDAAATMMRWRRHFAANGEREPLLLMAQVFEESDPRPFGMDAAVQFPPNMPGPATCDPASTLRFFADLPCGKQFSYQDVANNACKRQGDGYPLFRGLCPAWDNEARKPNAGVSLVGSSPDAYANWLARAIRSTLEERPLGTDLVFINAWNEWAEGAHLEPDRHFGHAYLRATCRALNVSADTQALNRFISDLEPAAQNVPPFVPDLTTEFSQPRARRIATGSPDVNAAGLITSVDAERYDGHNDDPFEVAGIMRAWMPSRSRVLDVGCGTGGATVIVNLNKMNDVICIEPDEIRAAKAQSRDLLVYPGPLDESFARAHGPFDVIMLTDVLEHLADPTAMLTRIRTALAPGGVLMISVPNVAHWSMRWHLLRGKFEYQASGLRDATHLRWFTASTIRRLLQNAGFEVVEQTFSAGQYLPEYHFDAPWRWMPWKLRRNVAKAGTRWMPRLFGGQHVLKCRLDNANAAPRAR